VLLGIEPDHFDCFHSWHELQNAFAQFIGRMAAQDWLLYSADCEPSARVAKSASCRCESFGFGAHADWQASIVDTREGRYRFVVRHRGVRLGQIALNVPGRHNVLNALAAAAAADHAGVSWSKIRQGLANFTGLSRRLEKIAERRQIAILDDFAHLPTEVAAGLTAVREMYPNRRLCCVFQPHQVSRTNCLLDEFAASLQNADTLMIADIYRAREPEVRAGEVTAADLAKRAAARGAQVIGARTRPEIVEQLKRGLQAGDVLVTMGAGDIGKIAHDIAEWL
jgi:UDP-N-acetylmuramate--alanine ligase